MGDIKIILLEEKSSYPLLMPSQIPTFPWMLYWLFGIGFESYDNNRVLFLIVINFACISILLYLDVYKEY